ncbi:MAG: glycosyltransferase [Armatimonadetes bacterium]|nr:glycosyltransferase [Armatimonadota bacterium]
MHVLEAMLGGTRRYLLDVALGLPRESFHQHVVVSLCRAERAEEDVEALRAASVEVTVLPMRRNLSPASDLSCMRALRRILFAWKPNVIHGHSAKGGFLARWAAHGLPMHPRPAIMYSPHCFPFQMRTDPLRRAMYLGLERLAASWCDVIVAVSEAEAEVGRQAGLRPRWGYEVVPPGLDAGKYSTIPRLSRAELGLPSGRILGFVGAMSHQKAPDIALHAFARMAADFPDASLVFVGDGPLRRRLEGCSIAAGLGNRVAFLGHRRDVPDLLPHFDAVVLTSRWEGLPYALLEAMAAARPVVAADLPGVADVVSRAGAGICFQSGSVSSAAAALGAMLALPESALTALGAAGRQYVEACFTLTGALGGLAELYQHSAVKAMQS